LSHLEIVGVMGGGDLDRAAAELRVGVGIGHDRDGTVHQRQQHLPAYGLPPAFIRRIHGHPGVPQHRFRTRGGHDHIRPSLQSGVADVPQMSLHLPLLHLQVRNDREALGTPIDQAFPPVDPPLGMDAHEGLQHGPDVALIERKPLPPPVIGTPQGPELPQDGAAILLPPAPDPLHQLLPAQIEAAQALLEEFLLDLHLGGNAGMVRSGQAEGVVALHPFPPDERVVDGMLQGMSHVQLARDVGRGNGDAIAGPPRLHVGVKVTPLLPPAIPVGLYLLGFIDLVQRLVFHKTSLQNRQ